MRPLKTRIFKGIAVFLLVNTLVQLALPLTSFALTSGPSQPEVQSFEPVGTTEMVDLFTGDFTYNIPLFDLPGPNGGYPFNLSYNAGQGMDNESSWVGLGFNLNPGVINRQMRGFPDDFNGDDIKRDQDIRPNTTIGINVAGDLEVFGADFDKGLPGAPNLSLGLGIYYNNYKGVGYSVDPGLSMQTTNKGASAGIGFNFSMDSQEGVGVSPNLSLSNHSDKNTSTFNIGASYNSRQGLTGASMGFSVQAKNRVFKQNGQDVTDGRQGTKSIGGHSRISFAGNAYSPQVSMPMQGRHVSLSVKTGGSVLGAFGNGYVSGFFNTQYLGDKHSSAPGFGYLYLHNAQRSDALMDFNREKDGQITRHSPNLPAPSMTHDIYTVAGQGISGMYRPYRSEVGTLYDQTLRSVTAGGSGGFDAGVGMPHIGGDLSISYASNTSGKWTGDDNTSNSYQFSGTGAADYEPYYFKTQGEPTSDDTAELNYIGGTEPVRIGLVEGGSVVDRTSPTQPTLIAPSGKTATVSKTNPTESRESRNLLVTPITNKDLTNARGDTSKEVLREYRVRYYEPVNNNIPDYRTTKTKPINRSRGKNLSHVAGLTATNPDGTRYVYALPAYNNVESECQFSVKPPVDSCTPKIDIDYNNQTNRINYDGPQYNNTDKSYNKTTVPAYAHSYLLTSILGPDYIDADNIPGPSTGDLGYWVKFNYVKTTVTDYQWRVPFTGANYMRGSNTTPWDDKGAYTYGTKEVWHLASAETATHIAVFSISKRHDGRGAARELQNSNEQTIWGEYSYKLNKISLYSRAEYEKTTGTPVPMKNVFFQYTYDLCGNVPNNDGVIETDSITGANVNARKGKLTLKKVWFTDENNYRGSLSPYVFNYNETSPTDNPSYNSHSYDRWGNYKSNGEVTLCDYMNFPYTDQNPASGSRNNDAAVWSLKSITLPSGGTITIKYEADDYAYVQNKQAMQMTKIYSLAKGSATGSIKHPKNATGYRRRVYFKLENSISSKLTRQQADSIVGGYVDDSRQLYFKVYIHLLKADQDNYQDYVSGYAPVESFGIDSSSFTGSAYTRGYIQLDKMKVGGKTVDFHPFSVAAWQHLRTAEPTLLNVGGYKGDPNTSEGQAKQKIRSLISTAGEIKRMFQGYYNYCYDSTKSENSIGKDSWANLIDLNKSFIRLNSKDKIKYGGGVRVKEIALKDNWDVLSGDSAAVYGQVYDYTIEENGQTISSGVAAYEPLIGGDENALRSAKIYGQSTPLTTPNNLFTELPMNENYYPGPQVGYRKVTVRSLATCYSKVSGSSDPYNIPDGIMTTGQTVHEFYTAKEFPVINKETEIDKRPYDLMIPIPLLGQITVNHLTASQGYSIELNDMHGKLKQVSYYGQDAYGNMLPDPISWVKYNYQCTRVYHPSGDRSKDYFVLNNNVPVVVNDKNGVVTTAVRTLGQDFDFFTDMRESRAFSCTGGLTLNTDVIEVGIPLPTFMPWPSIGTSTTQLRTVVTNKIIHRSGILVGTEAYDGSAVVRTDNRLFDYQTGQPMLTTVTNDYEDPVYNYNLPAHLVYDGMGAAYKNIGLNFTASLTSSGNNQYYVTSSGKAWESLIVPGDEFIVSKSGEQAKAIYTGIQGTSIVFAVDNNTGSISGGGTYSLLLVRSGKRNLLTATALSVSSLKDPSKRKSVSCSSTIRIPKRVRLSSTQQVVAQCTKDQISTINTYIKSGSFPSGSYTLSTVPCGSSGATLRTANAPMYSYLSYPGKGTFCFSSTTACTGSTCNAVLYEDSGNLIDFNYVDSLKNPQYVTSYPATISTTQTFKNMSFDVKYKTGVVHKAYAFGCLQWQMTTQTTYRDSLYTVDTTLTTTNYQLDSVLATGAKTYSANYGGDNNYLRGTYWTNVNRNAFSSKDAYVKGEAGLWREAETYAYSDNRKQSTTNNTRKDGTFNMNWFDWFRTVPSDCNKNWLLLNSNTDYAASLNTENRDILNIASGSLYGYEGRLVTAAATNAKNGEIGFEGFEEFQAGAGVNADNSGTGNLLFYTGNPNVAVNTYDNYRILSAVDNLIIIDKPYNANISIDQVTVRGYGYGTGKEIKGTYPIVSTAPDPSNAGNTIVYLNPIFTQKGMWNGFGKFRLKISDQVPMMTQEGSFCSIGNDYAHSGKNSFQVLGTVSIEQRRLNLIPGRKYFLSCWTKQPVSDYGNTISIKFLKADRSETATPSVFARTGNVIGNWQKIEGEFTMPSDAVSIVLTLTGNNEPTGNRYTSYFDDIRISPSDSEMESYVYDTGNLSRVKAILDNNNYATFFYYDASGSLFLQKKETERGIMTLQESFEHQYQSK